MQTDDELDAWRRQWQGHGAVPADLTQRVEREIRRARVGTVLALAVTVIVGGGVVIRAVTSRRPDDIVLALGVWMFIAITWIVALSLSRGASRPVAATTAAFMDFSILTCRRRRESITAAAVLYVALLAFMLVWQYRRAPIGAVAFLTAEPVLIFWGITAVLAALAVWRRRALERELRNLERLRDQPGEPRSR